MFDKFWAWYERHYALSLGVSLGLFLLQVLHLIWLFCAVVWLKLFGAPLVEFGDSFNLLIAIVDYTEVPSIIAISLVYINELRRGWSADSLFFLLLLNSQWLHLFWITDEVVVETLAAQSLVTMPVWLAWVAILIDYAEVPVMVDTTAKFFRTLAAGRRPDPKHIG